MGSQTLSVCQALSLLFKRTMRDECCVQGTWCMRVASIVRMSSTCDENCSILLEVSGQHCAWFWRKYPQVRNVVMSRSRSEDGSSSFSSPACCWAARKPGSRCSSQDNGSCWSTTARTFPVRLHRHESARGDAKSTTARLQELRIWPWSESCQPHARFWNQMDWLQALGTHWLSWGTGNVDRPQLVKCKSSSERPFDLDEEVFCRNLRSARRGATPGPSGMICEHFQPILESDRGHVAMLVARGCVPPMAFQVMRMGRLTALKKPQGGVRGIVVSDVFRRVIARTIAKQCVVAAEKATAPFQYALRTRAVADTHWSWPDGDNLVSGRSGSIRPRLTQCHAEGVVDHGRWRPSSALSGSSVVTHPLTCGKMILEESTASFKEKAGSKETR